MRAIALYAGSAAAGLAALALALWGAARWINRQDADPRRTRSRWRRSSPSCPRWTTATTVTCMRSASPRPGMRIRPRSGRRARRGSGWRGRTLRSAPTRTRMPRPRRPHRRSLAGGRASLPRGRPRLPGRARSLRGRRAPAPRGRRVARVALRDAARVSRVARGARRRFPGADRGPRGHRARRAALLPRHVAACARGRRRHRGAAAPGGRGALAARARRIDDAARQVARRLLPDAQLPVGGICAS